jgi:hypothetical protein
MPFGLGFFATAGAGAAGSFDLLETQVLGSSAASITFSSLSTYSNYKHLQIRFAGTQVDVGGLDSMSMRINGDTGSNYNTHYLRGLNSSIGSGAQGTNNYTLIGLMAGKGGSESSGLVIDFLDAFQTTKYKTVRSIGGAAGTGDKGVGLYSALWMNTNAIDSITLKGQTGNLLTGSRFSLYGLKGS